MTNVKQSMLSANKRMSSLEPPSRFSTSKKARAAHTPGRKPFCDLENKQHGRVNELDEISSSSSIFGDLFSGLKGYPPAKSSQQALTNTTGIAPLSPTEYVNMDLKHSQLVLRKRTQRAERCAVAAARARAFAQAIDVASPEECRRSSPSITNAAAMTPKPSSKFTTSDTVGIEDNLKASASTSLHQLKGREPQSEVAAVVVATPNDTGLKRKVSKKAKRKLKLKNHQQQAPLPYTAFQTPATRLQRLEAAHAVNLKVHVGVVATPGGGLIPAAKSAGPRTAQPPRSSASRPSSASQCYTRVQASESDAQRERALDLRWAAWLLRTNRIEPAAQLGHPEAMATLAERLLLGRGQGSRDRGVDVDRRNSSPATPEPLAVILGQGCSVSDDDEDGGEADPETAVHWAMKAAAAGDKGGQRLLGLAYRHGLGGLSVNFKLASEQFEAASLQGCGASMAHLAWLLTVGSPTLTSKASSAWSSFTARLPTTVRPNQHHLHDNDGDSYLAPSPHRAFWWYLQAAQSKNTRAKSRASAAKAVSECYANGFGITRDLEAAEQWAHKAPAAF